MTTAAAVARALGHDRFTLLGNGVVVMDDPNEAAPTQAAIDAAQATIDAEGEAPPTAVTARQARLALLAAGLLDTVETAIATLPQAERIEWEYASEIRRDHPLIVSLAAALSLTAVQVDALFITARGL